MYVMMMMHTITYESLRCQKVSLFWYDLFIDKSLQKMCFLYYEHKCVVMTEQSCVVATPLNIIYDTILYIGVHLLMLLE